MIDVLVTRIIEDFAGQCSQALSNMLPSERIIFLDFIMKEYCIHCGDARKSQTCYCNCDE